jgi:ADP-heptose:LPS heptosyltransferase
MAMLAGQSRVVSAVGRTGTRELVQLIGACDLFIGSDSGPRHIADAQDIPSIGIFSGNVDSVEWGPSSASAVGVRRRMVCSPCYIALPEDCPRATACMTELEPAAVMDLVRKMVAGRPKMRRPSMVASPS